MEQVALYLLKSAAWLTAFTLVYLLFLQKERFFMLKRIYLLAGMILSLLLPLVTLHYRIELPAPLMPDTQGITSAPPLSVATAAQVTEHADLLKWFMIIYSAGILLIFGRTLKYLLSVCRTVRSGPVDREGGVLLVRTEKNTFAFSFFNYVFINPSLCGREVREIINHEMVHLRQKHWFDLLLVELVSIVQWMNPFAWICSALVRQNHEHLADEEALQRTSDPAAYRAALLNQVFNARLINLSNPFNFSFNTDRFEMMKKKNYSPLRKLKLLLVLPLAAILLLAFADPVYTYGDRVRGSLIKNIQGIVVKEDGTPFAGVSVNVSGTSLSVITDEAGRFYFIDLPAYVGIVFSDAGYEPVTLTAESAHGATITMKVDQSYANRGSMSQGLLVIIDGQVSDLSLEEATKKLGKDFGNSVYLDPAQAKSKYGDKGEKGAFEITSRSKAKESGISLPYPRADEADFPTFRGESFLSFADWVAERAKYPADAASRNVSGWVRMGYTVDTDGSVSGIKAISDSDPALVGELTRVMKSSPRWERPANKEANEPFTSEIVIRFQLPDRVSNGVVYVLADEMPQFPGGDTELFNWFNGSLKYPDQAKGKGIQGRVTLRFVVTSDGYVEDVNVVRGVDPLLDDEAVRVMSQSPQWKPGKIKGKPVNIYYLITIKL